MKRKQLLVISILIMLIIWGGIAIEKGSDLFTSIGLELVIFIIIVVIGVIAFVFAMKKNKEIKEGFPKDDELSNMLKYKSGYYAFLASMYMWLFIFYFKDKFPDIETMLGGGILLSALIFYISKIIVKQKFND